MSAVVWTAEQIRRLGVRVDGVTAMRIAYGVGRTKAYELLRSGEAGLKVIRVPGARNQYVVPVSELLRVLGLDEAH
jgi:hypothetical protein